MHSYEQHVKWRQSSLSSPDKYNSRVKLEGGGRGVYIVYVCVWVCIWEWMCMSRCVSMSGYVGVGVLVCVFGWVSRVLCVYIYIYIVYL